MDQSKIEVGLLERWALAYLGRYASTAENLRWVLQRRVRRRFGEDTEAMRLAAPLIDQIVERYCHSGLIDDAAYAARRAESLHQRGESLAKIRARLVTKGVAGSVAADALAALRANAADPDLVAACALRAAAASGPIGVATYSTRRASLPPSPEPVLAGASPRLCWRARTPKRPMRSLARAAADLSSGDS